MTGTAPEPTPAQRRVLGVMAVSPMGLYMAPLDRATYLGVYGREANRNWGWAMSSQRRMLERMAVHGWVQRCKPTGWVITEAGRAMVEPVQPVASRKKPVDE